MKRPQLSVALPFVMAASLLCLGIFQACQTRCLTCLAAHLASEETSPCGGTEAEPVEIRTGSTDDQKKKILKDALKKAKKSNARFCKRKGKHGRSCEEISHVYSRFGPVQDHGGNVASIVSGICTMDAADLTKFESGDGDDQTEAIHVAQMVEFKTPTKKKL